MFDIGGLELLVIIVVALVVIGPKDLPVAIRAVTMVIRKMRGMAREFQHGLEEIAREAGVDDIKRSVEEDITYDPKEALESLGAIDEGEFSLGGDSAPPAGNSIRDPAAPEPSSEPAPESAQDEATPAATPAEPAQEQHAEADDDQPSPAHPVPGTS